MLIFPGLTIGFAVTAIVALGLGSSVSRWVMFTWPSITIIWALGVMSQERIMQQQRITIALQARVIRNQSETLTQILTEEDKHDQQ